MMRLSSVCLRVASHYAARATPLASTSLWKEATAFRPQSFSFRRSFTTVAITDTSTCLSATDSLHRIVEEYRLKKFPETMPQEFVDQVLNAADENKDGLIQVSEMMVMLRNLYSHQDITVEEVRYIMENQLDMLPEDDAVPMDRVRALLLDIHH